MPLGKLTLIDTPFKRVTVDIVDPIEPRSEKRNRYILNMIDYATRYPEAVALPSIETERVAEALVEMLSRVGIPDEMLTDCGSQFTAEVMKEVSRLQSLQQLTTTPYHPMCNGLVERFHATMKHIENGYNSAEESDMGAWKGANMRRENVNLEQPLARVQSAARFQVMENRDENPVVIQQSEGIETDNEQAVGDVVGPRVSRLVYLDDILFHARVFKSMRR